MDTLGHKNASPQPLVNPSMLVLYELCWKILANLLIPVDSFQNRRQMELASVRYFEAPRSSPMSLYKASSEHLVSSLNISISKTSFPILCPQNYRLSVNQYQTVFHHAIFPVNYLVLCPPLLCLCSSCAWQQR